MTEITLSAAVSPRPNARTSICRSMSPRQDKRGADLIRRGHYPRVRELRCQGPRHGLDDRAKHQRVEHRSKVLRPERGQVPPSKRRTMRFEHRVVELEERIREAPNRAARL